LNSLTTPPDPATFNALVWDIVRQIPPGRVVSYGQVARLIPPPEGVDAQSYQALGPRWVGSAMASCPAGVPWQRVINSKGEISLRAGAQEQRRLLEAEGIVFDTRGRVDLKRFGWRPGASADTPRLFPDDA
jgi:methylated-DNA-protein-cysteine methyltransferase related protein